MAEKKSPSGEEALNAPDTARVYERAKPEAESGMGRLDNNKGTPEQHADRIAHAVANKQELRQINAEDEEPSVSRETGRE